MKKITRFEKIKLSKQGICWKCKSKFEKINKGIELLCKKCGNRIKLK